MKKESLDKKITNIFRANQQISIFFNPAQDSRKAREQEEQKEQEEKEKLLRVKTQGTEPQNIHGPVKPKEQEQGQLQKKEQVQPKAQELAQPKEQIQVQQKEQEPVHTNDQEPEQQEEQTPEQPKELEPEQQKEQGQQLVYQSSIELVTANNMEISAPIKQGVPVFLEKGDNFLIRIRFRNETYEFKSSYIYRRIGQTPIWIIQTPYDGNLIQERVHTRINFPALVKAWPVKKKESNIQYFGQPKSSVPTQSEDPIVLLIKDISTGGLRVISKLPYSLKSKLRLSFGIPDYGEIKVSGQVLRVQTYKHENMTLFFNGIKFLDISDKDFHALDAFISKKQNEINQK